MSYKSLLLHLELARSNHHLTSLGSDLAGRLGADIIGIAGCQPVKVVYDENLLAGEILAQDRMEIQRELEVAEKHFRDDLAKHKNLQWRSTVTYESLAAYIAQEARSADLVVTGPDIGGKMFSSTRRVQIAELVMQAGRPVLIVPHKCKALPLKHALVAWKNTTEARRALNDALPLLKLSEKVSLVSVVPDAQFPHARGELADVSAWLLRHGIAATAEVFGAAGEDSVRLGDIAADKGADLVVAGAYGHGRFQEWLLGGVTMDLLLHADRCVLVSH